MKRLSWFSKLIIASAVIIALGIGFSVLHNAYVKPKTTEYGAAPDWIFSHSQIKPTYAEGGMVASTDAVASEIGVATLKRGGNAVDAAIAVQFALAVVNPEAGNIGGGGFMIVHMKNGETAALDFREKAPLAATQNMFVDEHGELTEKSWEGHLASGVPGSVAGMWAAHKRFGTLPWATLIAPAIDLAKGMTVHERLARSLNAAQESLKKYQVTASIFLPNGKAPNVNEKFVQADLAKTLERIAKDGQDGFYQGETAQLIEAEMKNGGGIITREDLARYKAVWREPIVFKYRSYTVISMPPPSSGGVALAELLNILEGYNLTEFGFLSAKHIHVWAEAAKRAFVDRNTYLADPDFVTQPTATLISDEYAAKRRAEINIDHATPIENVRPGLGEKTNITEKKESKQTTHYSVLDGNGNAVSVTTTINGYYGNLVTVTGAGFLLNNEMDDFAASKITPNQYGLVQGEQNNVAPEKRMLSSMSPTILLDESGAVKLVTGSPGGPTIISTVAQIISDVVDFNMSIESAVSAPRIHNQYLPDVISFEHNGLTQDVQTALRLMGHNVKAKEGYQGDTQSILVMPNGIMAGISDPRKGGAALGVRDVGDD